MLLILKGLLLSYIWSQPIYYHVWTISSLLIFITYSSHIAAYMALYMYNYNYIALIFISNYLQINKS
jgi:hypothetical protein